MKQDNNLKRSNLRTYESQWSEALRFEQGSQKWKVILGADLSREGPELHVHAPSDDVPGFADMTELGRPRTGVAVGHCKAGTLDLT